MSLVGRHSCHCLNSKPNTEVPFPILDSDGAAEAMAAKEMAKTRMSFMSMLMLMKSKKIFFSFVAFKNSLVTVLLKFRGKLQ